MRIIHKLDRFLKPAGHFTANIWCISAMLVIFISLIASNLFVLMAVGFYFSHWFKINSYVILGMGIIFGLFFGIYVWEPYVKSRLITIIKVMRI